MDKFYFGELRLLLAQNKVLMGSNMNHTVRGRNMFVR